MQLFRSRFIVLLSLLAIVVVAGAFAACSSDDNASSTPTKSASAATSVAAGSHTAAATTAAAGDNVAACPPAGAAAKLTGAGSTFDNPLFTDWFSQYKTLCNVEVNYQSIGSGGGIQQITAKTVDFGASDGIMSSDEKSKAPGPIHHIPVTSDAVAIVFNLDGVNSAGLTLNPDTLAAIFLGKITKWDDPKIKALNSGVNLPSEDITVVHRSDGSGTTFIFTDYLSKVSTDWKTAVGTGKSVQWPVGVGAQGNEGVSGQITQLPGSIAYISLGYVKANNITYAKMVNKSGKAIEPTIESARLASEGVSLPANTEIMITDSSNPNAYPITGFSWVLIYAAQDDKAKAETLGHVVHWMLTDAQQFSADLNYVPLSTEARDKGLALLADTRYQGTPITQQQ